MSPEENQFQGPSGPRDLPTKALATGRGKAALVAVLTLLSMSATGCSVMHNGYTALTRNSSWNDTVVVLRNRSHSAKAWHKRKQNFCNERHSQDFCNGFRAGFEAVCNGSDGCTPAFPPPEYWSWEYQSGEGQARTSSWFSGYPYGVQAAEEEGAANWHQIQISPNMRNQFQNAGMLNPTAGSSIAAPGMSSMGNTMVPLGLPGVPQNAPMLTPEAFGPVMDLPGIPAQGVVPQVQ
jgi:hypothetical protein